MATPGVTVIHNKVAGAVGPPAPQPPTKKRKLNKSVPVTQLLSDHPVIQKTVHNLLGLLETYGPLTVGQLEYNLPPIVGERVSGQTIHDIVQVLVCLGLVQRVVEPPVGSNTNNNGLAPAPSPKPPSPRYCVHQGVPRADVVLPQQLLDKMSAAHNEIKRSAERRKRLKEALQSKASPKELLKELAIEFPEILQDPVYVTALKSLHIDVTMTERERRMRQQQQALRAAQGAVGAASVGAASDTVKKTENQTSAPASSTAQTQPPASQGSVNT